MYIKLQMSENTRAGIQTNLTLNSWVSHILLIIYYVTVLRGTYNAQQGRRGPWPHGAYIFILSSWTGTFRFSCLWTSKLLVLRLLDFRTYTSRPLVLRPYISDWIMHLDFSGSSTCRCHILAYLNLHNLHESISIINLPLSLLSLFYWFYFSEEPWLVYIVFLVRKLKPVNSSNTYTTSESFLETSGKFFLEN